MVPGETPKQTEPFRHAASRKPGSSAGTCPAPALAATGGMTGHVAALFRHPVKGFTPEALPRTDRILAGLIDMRLPLTFSVADVDQIARILTEEAAAAARAEVPGQVAAVTAD